MDRRRFVAAAGSALALPRAFAQVARLRRIGYFAGGSQAGLQPFRDAFLGGMRERGWVEGQNLEVVSRYAEGNEARLPVLAEELLAANCEVIFTTGATTVPPLLARTQTVPIVSSLLHDAVGQGMAKSVARPGGNVTGTSTFNHEILSKRIELLRECVPGLKTLGVLYSPTLEHVKHGAEVIAEISPRLGLRCVKVEFARQADLARAFAHVARERCEALIVQAYPLTVQARAAIAESAIQQRVAALGELSQFAVDGGLLSHGPSWEALFRRAASHVDRILRGAKAGDLPIEFPTVFETVANLKTAAAIGVRLPQTILLRADRVIE